jgi:hypothetical protein
MDFEFLTVLIFFDDCFISINMIKFWKIFYTQNSSFDFLPFVAVFSSPEVKAQMSYSDRQLSVVRLSVCKLLHF